MFDDREVLDRLDVCRLCIGPTFETELILRWIHDFVNLSNRNTSADQKTQPSLPRIPFFAFAMFSCLTHDDFNEAAHMDAFLESFFSRLMFAGLLRRTAVILFSDHGTRYGISRGVTRTSWYEENLPMAFIAMPQEFQQRHPKQMSALRLNANRLTTPFDLHETIRRVLTVVDGAAYDDKARQEAGRRGVSLLDVEITDRTCDEASIAPTYCECVLSATVSVSVSDARVWDVARRTVDLMNSRLSVYNGSCSRLSLRSVDEARLTNQTSVTNHQIFYTLTFRTEPGEGLFQAMVGRLPDGAIVIRADILRISPYAPYAGCIVHIVHKKWCHCSSIRTNKA
jgi:hypothetical protein